MRLQQYINENTLSNRTRGQLSDYIANNCKPFLKEFGKDYIRNNFIYRGLKGQNVKTFRVLKPRTDRLPRFINKDLHAFMNKMGKKLFGWNIRSDGVFTGNHMKAKTYGQKTIFIPSGNYKYVWIKNTDDIYDLYDRYNYHAEHLKDIKKFNESNKDDWIDYFKDVEKSAIDKSKKDIDDALTFLNDFKLEIEDIYSKDYKTSGLVPNSDKYNFEAIFKCKEYIVMAVDHSYELQLIIKELII